MGLHMSDDLTFDFLKWFKKKPSDQSSSSPATEHSSVPDATPSVNPKKAWAWCMSHQAVIIPIVLIFIALFVSVNVRVQSVDIPIGDDYANNNVNSFIHDDITRAFTAQYPNLPDANRNNLINTEYSKAIGQTSYTIKTGDIAGQTFNLAAQRAAMAQDFKSFFQYDSNGVSYMYMPDIDPYTWLRYARNILEHGDMADERRNGIAYDNHMVAPLGATIDATFHPYVLAWTYRIMHVFNSSITLMHAAGYFPVIMIALCIIPVFFIGRKIGGNTAGIFGAIIFAVNGALLSRTNWGHADTDPYNVFFPLMVLWLFLLAYDCKKVWTRLTSIGLSGLKTRLFAYVWSGWW